MNQPAIWKLSLLSAVVISGVSSLSLMASDGVSKDTMIDEASEVKQEVSTAYTEQLRIGRHVYIGTGLGLSHLNPDTSEVPKYDTNDSLNMGAQITLGMDISRQFSVELHSADLGSAGLSPTGRINYHMYSASALVYAGKNRHAFKRQGLTAFGRLGYGLLENTPVGDVPFVKDNANHVLLGFGVEYMTKIGLGLRAELISYDEDVQYGQLGLMYRMGKKPVRKPIVLAAAPIEEVIEEPIQAQEPVEVPIIEPFFAAAEVAPQFSVCDQSGELGSQIYFDSDSIRISRPSIDVLERAGDTLLECDNLNLNLEAHADGDGSEAYNQTLSEQRAMVVMRYLRNKGVASLRLSAESYGETRPAASNATEDGRQQNRRVELSAQ